MATLCGVPASSLFLEEHKVGRSPGVLYILRLWESQ